MNARQLMTSNPQIVTGDEPVSHAAKLMRDHNIGMLPVVDDRSHRHPRGVITDRDIVIRGVAERLSPDRPIEDLMTMDHLAMISPDANIARVMLEMSSKQIRRVLVVENGRLIGVIAQADLALKEGPLKPLVVEQILERVSAP